MFAASKEFSASRKIVLVTHIMLSCSLTSLFHGSQIHLNLVLCANSEHGLHGLKRIAPRIHHGTQVRSLGLNIAKFLQCWNISKAIFSNIKKIHLNFPNFEIRIIFWCWPLSVKLESSSEGRIDYYWEGTSVAYWFKWFANFLNKLDSSGIRIPFVSPQSQIIQP